LDYKKECSSKGMNREKGKVEIKREKQLNWRKCKLHSNVKVYINQMVHRYIL
jgi:hypothetical protein